MRVAVVFDQKEKHPTTALQRMANFYRFDWRSCNARAGWEKGNVERSVDFVRGRAFTSCMDFTTIADAQKWLYEVCQQINSEAGSASTADKTGMIDEELGTLLPWPGVIGCFEMAEYKADKQSTICVRNNHYSVPDRLACESVIVQMYSERIVIYDKTHKKVAEHQRSYGANEWIVDIDHYINTLLRKTSAIQYSEAFHQMPMSMQVIFHRFFKENGKEFLHLVRYVRENGIAYEDVLKAADTLRYNGVKTFTADHFKVALQTMNARDEPFREEQKSDEFIEIEIGSEDILSQLENVMEKGADNNQTNL
jgi:hypothetical protein